MKTLLIVWVASVGSLLLAAIAYAETDRAVRAWVRRRRATRRAGYVDTRRIGS